MNHIIAIVIFIQDIFISLITVINTSNKKNHLVVIYYSWKHTSINILLFKKYCIRISWSLSPCFQLIWLLIIITLATENKQRQIYIRLKCIVQYKTCTVSHLKIFVLKQNQVHIYKYLVVYFTLNVPQFMVYN